VEALSTPTKKTIYLSFRSHVISGGFETVTRNLTIGCVKTGAAAKKVRTKARLESNFHATTL